MDWVQSDQQEASRLATAVVGAMRELKQLTPAFDAPFIPRNLWGDTDTNGRTWRHLATTCNRRASCRAAEAIIPRYRFALSDYILTQPTITPTHESHRLIAEFILRNQAGPWPTGGRRWRPRARCQPPWEWRG
jgi:hypothetical protein